MLALTRLYITSGIKNQVNVIVAWYNSTMSQRPSFHYLTNVEVPETSLQTVNPKKSVTLIDLLPVVKQSDVQLPLAW